ncbi:hypothetical protein FQA39_LY00924 [Lamprigera yunnana]|nr:hypothetical protein FQA39_LY00924 [Lamprigera yunnana]
MNYAVLCVLLLTVSVVDNCLLLQDENTDDKDCFLDVVRQTFKEDDTLCIVTDEDFEMLPFNEITNPYLLVNINKSIQLKLKSNKFIILSKHEESLKKMIQILRKSEVWDKIKFSKALWDEGIVDVVILVRSDEKNFTMHMSNPYDNDNNCGRTFKKFTTQPCRTKFKKLIQFPTINLGKCNIKCNTSITKYKLKAYDKMLNFFCDELTKNNNSRNYIATISSRVNSDVDSEKSKIVYRQNWIWVTSEPERVFPIETITVLFQKEVWILTGLVFVTVIIFWWLIATTRISDDAFSQVCRVFMIVTSLTLDGTVSSIPTRKILRYIFLIYSMYALLIQTAFKTNLIKNLTIPQFNSRIGSVKEVIDLNLTVYVSNFTYKYVTSYQDLSMYNPIKKNLIIHKPYPFYTVYNCRNTSIMMTESDFLGFTRNQTRKFNTFIDNHVTGTTNAIFRFTQGHKRMENVNKLITALDESGILQKKYKDFHFRKKHEDDEPIEPLNLNHLHFIFVFWVLGLTSACVAFVAEHGHCVYVKNKIK